MQGAPSPPGSGSTVAIGRALPAALGLLAALAPASPIAAQATHEPDSAATHEADSAAAPAAPAATAPAIDDAPTRGPEARLHSLVNRRRQALGCRPLAWHATSAAVAEARSVDMIDRRYFDHVTPDGRTVFDEVADAGIEVWGSVAENIALTQAGAPSVLEMWRDSPAHRRNLDNCSYTHHGLGERGGVWTQILLAQPKKAAPAAGLSRPARASPRR